MMRSVAATRQPTPPARRFSRFTRLPCVVLLLVLTCGWLAACESTQEETPGDATPGNQPTETITPAGDVLRIQNEPIRHVFIPDPVQDPLYALTDTALHTRAGGGWVPTGATNDGRTLLVDPQTPERLFRGGHPPCDKGQDEPGILFEISEDAGQTWTVVRSIRNVKPLAVDPNFPETIYGSDCSLTFSTNSGRSWSRLPLMEGYDITDVAFVGTHMLALGISTEGKSRLREIDLTDPLIPTAGDVLLDIHGVACLDASDDRLVVGSRRGVLITDDGGETWTESRIGLEEVTRGDDELPAQLAEGHLTEPWGVLAIEIDPDNKQRVFAGTTRGLFVSQDGGATWVRYDEVRPDVPVTAIAFGLDGADLYVTTGEGVVVVPNP